MPPNSPALSLVQKTKLVATLTSADTLASADLDEVAILEVRADLTGELSLEWLRSQFPGQLLYTLRSSAEGGKFDGGAPRRAERLIAAARAGFDLVDLEADRDLGAAVLEAVPGPQRILSWHGSAADPTDLARRCSRMAETPAWLYKLIPQAHQAGQELAPLQMLAKLKRSDVVAFASGASGAWSRLVAPRLGAPVVYGAVGGVPGAPGQPTVGRLRSHFGLPNLPSVEVLFGIAGCPVEHSLSPLIHNSAYSLLGLPALYIPFHAESFGDFWLEVVESEALSAIGLPLRGLSVTSPFKRVALAVAGASSPLAERIGAANTLVWNSGVWEAESTDPAGIVEPLGLRGISLEGRRAVVVGCGGAGRSAAVGLLHAQVEVVMANRSAERGRRAAYDLGLPFMLMEDLDPQAFDLFINATPLGRSEEDPLPFDLDRLPKRAVVVDMVYGENPTALVQESQERGWTTVDGREVLFHQAVVQFRLMTGQELPREAVSEALGLPMSPDK